MATLLYRLGRTAYRRWPFFIVGWIVLIAAMAGFASAKGKDFNTSFNIPGIPSVKAADMQRELFPNATAADKEVGGQLVIEAPEGKKLTDEPYKSQINTLMADMKKAPQISAATKKQSFVDPATLAAAQKKQLLAQSQKQGIPTATAERNAQALSPLSENGRAGIISWDFDVTNQTDVTDSTKDTIRDDATKAAKNGLTVVAGGQGMEAAFEPGGASELIGIGVALVVLIFTFGSLVAAGMPIVGAITGLALGTLGVTAATAFTDIPDTTTALSSMIGLAVGIDYSLFILSRYRAELRHTDDRTHAMGKALGTAGSAVLFAGLTVLIALSAFAVLGISLLTYMGLGAAFTVVCAVGVALTLLPAFMGLLKGKAFAGAFRKDRAADESDHNAVNASVRLGTGIRRAPWLVALVVMLGLGALAVPAKDLHLGLPSDATAAKGTDARTAADIIGRDFGAGRNAPMIAVVDARKVDGGAQKRMAAVADVVKWASSDSGVANAQVVGMNQDQTGAIVQIQPKTGPADEATDDMLDRLRDGQGGEESKTGATIGITGQTAIQADVSEKLNNALAPYLAIVVGLAFILLMIVFRSVVVPLLATLGFLLSVLAALGVTVKLVQDGTFGVFDPQPVMSFMPTLLIGIVFGLAMDYQVFLTTRMREAYTHGMDAKDAVIDGFRHSGRVVTAAALIMISVFAAFASQDNALIKSIGVALACAVFFDAFLVRMVLIPAIMLMLGRHAWWLPRWLDRIIPNVDVEGTSLQDGALAAGAAGSGRRAGRSDRGATAVTAGPAGAVAAGAAVAGSTAVGASSGSARPDVAAQPSGTARPAQDQAAQPSGVAGISAALDRSGTARQGAEPAADPAGPGIGGVVRQGPGHTVQRAQVTLLDPAGEQVAQTQSGEDGQFHFTLPHGGTYLMVVASEHVSPQAFLVPVVDRPVWREVTLAGLGTLTGRVVQSGAQGDLPMAGALVSLTNIAGEVVASARSARDGGYSFDGLVGGSYVVTAQSGRNRPEARMVQVADSGVANVDLALSPGGRVVGSVNSAQDGRLLSDVAVTLTSAEGETIDSVTTGAEGAYAFDNVPAGEYTLTASGFAPQAQRVTIVDDGVQDVNFEFGGSGTPAPRQPVGP